MESVCFQTRFSFICPFCFGLVLVGHAAAAAAQLRLRPPSYVKVSSVVIQRFV